METIHARVGSFWSRNEPTIPQGLPPCIAKNPAPRSPFIRSTRVSHSESENCDSFAYVELNACGASCSARRRTALKTRVFSGVIGSIVIKRVPKGSNRTCRFVRFYDTTSRMTGKQEGTDVTSCLPTIRQPASRLWSFESLRNTSEKLFLPPRRSYSVRSIISGSMCTARNTAGIVAKTDAAAIAANGSISIVASVART